jgi:hypothetical protein
VRPWSAFALLSLRSSQSAYGQLKSPEALNRTALRGACGSAHNSAGQLIG